MKNYVQDGKTLALIAPYNVASGAGAKIGAIFGVAVDTVLSAAEGQFKATGVFDLAALSTATGLAGARAYWDDSNKRVDTDATVGMMIGTLTAAKTNGQTTARVKLNEAAPDQLEGVQAAIADVATADATDLATAVTLVNALKVKLNALLASLRITGQIAP